MRICAVLVPILLLGAPCYADDLVLKDGRRLAWKTLSDEGESYAVETKDGKKLTIKKADVERIAVGGEEPAKQPLTGATFAVDSKKAVIVDLLPKAKTESTNGAWKSAPGLLANTGENPARVTISFDHELPEEYDLNLRIERGGGNGGFEVGIVSGDSSGCFHFDAFGAASSFFGQIGGQFAPKVDGQVFKPGKARVVRVAVRKDAVLVQVDGKDFWKSPLDWRAVTLHGDVPKPEPRKVFLTAAGGAWKVAGFTITQVK